MGTEISDENKNQIKKALSEIILSGRAFFRLVSKIINNN